MTAKPHVTCCPFGIMFSQYHINLILCSTLRDLSVNYYNHTANISLDSRRANVTEILPKHRTIHYIFH